ncbi:hypothetical protein HDU67_008574, partial [Dinochytrium kinnereticum]
MDRKETTPPPPSCVTIEMSKVVAGWKDAELSEEVKMFRDVAVMMKRAKKFVAVTGAGISVSAGIPDFRSVDGLYNLVKNRYPTTVLKGKDLFDASLFRDATSTNLFFEFMAELKGLADTAPLTPTHLFLKDLEHQGRLNIDCLEKRPYTPKPTPHDQTTAPHSTLQTLQTAMSTLSTTSPRSPTPPTPAAPQTPTTLRRPPSTTTPHHPVLIQLHGSLDAVICSLCLTEYPFTVTHHGEFSRGHAPQCPRCLATCEERAARGKRSVATGTLRPNVVLYGEHHGGGARIGVTAAADARRRIDVLMVLGTSLKVDGVRRLVRDLARATRARGGRVVLVNRCSLGREWECFFDYLVLGDCDEVVGLVCEEWERVPGRRRRVGKVAGGVCEPLGMVPVKLGGVGK